MNFLTTLIGGPYKWAIAGAAILVVVLGIYAKGHHDGSVSVQNKWDIEKAQQAIELAKHNAEVADIVLQSAKISDEASIAYDQKIENIRKYYESNSHSTVKQSTGRVCNSASNRSGDLSTVPNTAVAADEEAANDGYVAPGIKIETLPERCAETTQQLLELQGWVLSQKRNSLNAR